MMEKMKHFRLKWILRMGFCLALIAVMVLIGAVLAGAEEVKYSEGLKFTSNGDGTCSVSGIGSCTDTDIVIPPVSPAGDSVTSIGDYAFYECSNLTSITIPEGVMNIGDSAFSYCRSLTITTIPEGVTSIGNNAFYYCDSLMGITIPEGVTSIGDYAFSVCRSLASITIPASVTNIGVDAFSGCRNLIQTENGISYVDKWVIDCSREVTQVTLRNDTVGIGDSAFSWCNLLTSITIPEGATSIGNKAFYYCPSLASINIPQNSKLTNIGWSAFDECSSLTSITIPDGVMSIGYGAFTRCISLTSITIPEGVTSIGNNMFYRCTSLTSIIFSEGLKLSSIGEYAFSGCTALTSITIPEGVTSIGVSAFSGCTALTSITIPTSLASISRYAFNCHSLTDVYYFGTEEQWKNISIGYANDPLLNATIHFLGDIETKITSASLTLGQSLALNYYATLTPAHTAAQMRFTYHGETITVDGILDETTGEYKFTLGRIPPQCMGDNVKAELILISADGTETVLDVKEFYSIREYCDDALAAKPDNEALATLLADLLAYGDAAQDYANYNEDTPVSEGFEVAPSEWEDVTDTDFTLKDKTREELCFTAAGVRFGYVNRVYFKIKAADLMGVTLTVNGKTYTADDLTLAEDTADTYIFYTEAVYATEFDKVFTAELSADGEVIQTVTYSVKSYVCAKQNSNDTEIAALVKALYNYGRSAIAYKNTL